jgi:aryl-alcohol dehydrogenase-like predicted oxidoreductase
VPTIGESDLDVFPLCLGGNVFGWTTDEERSFSVLDAYVAAGGNFIDTADVYSAFVPGNVGGESEGIIGRWMSSRGNRDKLVIATKVGSLEGLEGLSQATISAAAEQSLGRLQTDYIDLYYAHRDDPEAPQDETLAAFDALVSSGKVRYIGASNYSADRLASALEISKREGLARFIALQPEYNLMDRDGYEGELQELCGREDLGCIAYFALAKGFLSGKYRKDGPVVESPRAQGVRDSYFNDRGFAVLEKLDEFAAAHDTSVAGVALAWLNAQPTVVAPIASATSTEQLAELIQGARLQLSEAEVSELSAL